MSRKNELLLLGLILLVAFSAWIWVSLPLPNSQRWWDEGHSMKNVEHLVIEGGWAPTFGWYPALSHLPLAALLKLLVWARAGVGLDSPGIIQPNGRIGPWAYWAGRWMSAGLAILVVLWTHRFGRRTFSPGVGLLAALFVASSISIVRFASIFKPDMLMLLLFLLAFSAAVRALEDSSFRRYLAAGGLIGLAASAKQTGAYASLPLIFTTLLHPKELRRWLALAAAGLASILVFLVINPDPYFIGRYLAQSEIYEDWAAKQPEKVSTLIYLPVLAMQTNWHGPVVGAAAWVGLVALAVGLVRSRLGRPHDGAKALMIALVLTYPLVCSIVSTYPKFNIFLPTLPFTAVSAAWLFVEGWKRLSARLPGAARRPAAAMLLLALVVTIGVPVADYVYRGAVVETTGEAAAARIERDAGPFAHREIIYEEAVGAPRAEIGGFKRKSTYPLYRSVERLLDLEPLPLDLADYEIFSPDRLSAPEAERYQARINRLATASVWRVEPRFLSLRGESQIVLAHPWRKHSTRALAWKKRSRTGRPSARLPRKLREGQVVSFDLAWEPEIAEQCELRLGGERLEIFHYFRRREGSRFMTPRAVLGEAGKRQIEIGCRDPEALAAALEVAVISWRPDPADYSTSTR